jgi:hypothetical protein
MMDVTGSGVLIGCVNVWNPLPPTQERNSDPVALGSTHATAVLKDVTVNGTGQTGFWFRASGECSAENCTVENAGRDGFCVDAVAPVTLTRCSASSCANSGAIFDFPSTILQKMSDKARDKVNKRLALTAHSAQGLECKQNKWYGILIKFVSVDLSEARVTRSSLNGLRVTHERLVGAAARITLTGASFLENGKGEDAKCDEGETFGIALERDAGGASRMAALEPWPGKDPDFWPDDAVRLRDNKGGALVEA